MPEGRNFGKNTAMCLFFLLSFLLQQSSTYLIDLFSFLNLFFNDTSFMLYLEVLLICLVLCFAFTIHSHCASWLYLHMGATHKIGASPFGHLERNRQRIQLK